jgi:hypothetical protein
MKRIFKYPLVIDAPTALGFFTVGMPKGAKVLHVHSQGESIHPVLWALVDPESPHELREFAVIGTGNPCDIDLGNYIDSAHCGPFVWHVFEVEK